MPGPHVLASGALDGLLLLVFAVLGFVVVAGVAAVILALLHAVLPSGDAGADALHRAEQEEEEKGKAEQEDAVAP